MTMNKITQKVLQNPTVKSKLNTLTNSNSFIKSKDLFQKASQSPLVVQGDKAVKIVTGSKLAMAGLTGAGAAHVALNKGDTKEGALVEGAMAAGMASLPIPVSSKIILDLIGGISPEKEVGENLKEVDVAKAVTTAVINRKEAKLFLGTYTATQGDKVPPHHAVNETWKEANNALASSDKNDDVLSNIESTTKKDTLKDILKKTILNTEYTAPNDKTSQDISGLYFRLSIE